MPNIIYIIEKDCEGNLVKVFYCGKCFNHISLLGLKDKKSGKIKFICNKCNKILLGDENELW